MIIGFTRKTSKILARVFCKNFRHCIVIFEMARGKMILVQIGSDGVRLIPINKMGIQKLVNSGWVFVQILDKKSSQAVIPAGPEIHCTKSYFYFKNTISFLPCPVFPSINILTCVGFAKRATRIKNPLIWTPDALYKNLIKKNLPR